MTTIFNQLRLLTHNRSSPQLRHDASEVELARFGKYDRALGGQRFAEQDSADADDEPEQRASPLFDWRRRRSSPSRRKRS
jgi:hypothetical protein